MSTSPSPKKSARSSNSTGAKVLITAASLATVVGGWAALALQQSTLNAQKSVAVADDTSQIVLDLPPLPTLVPEPSSMPAVTSPKQAVSPPLTLVPYNLPGVNTSVVSTPVANLPSVSAPSGGKENAALKGSSGKAANKPAKDPVSHTGSSK